VKGLFTPLSREADVWTANHEGTFPILPRRGKSSQAGALLRAVGGIAVFEVSSRPSDRTRHECSGTSLRVHRRRT